MTDNSAKISVSGTKIINQVKIATISAMFNWMGDMLLYPLDTISTRLKASKFVKHNSISYALSTIKN